MTNYTCHVPGCKNKVAQYGYRCEGCETKDNIKIITYFIWLGIILFGTIFAALLFPILPALWEVFNEFFYETNK